ncbi:C40 family peptidase [Bacillus solitudinis]|uniref:C40 family peptidase n=1 Tax=Bacillus solitudinis TaxID=2014074 RepID=UPI000C23D999|nr:peptidoglycan-binding protein [Bacillus solitudinis]
MTDSRVATPITLSRSSRIAVIKSKPASSTLKRTVLTSTLATGVFLSTPLLTEAALGDYPLDVGMSNNDVKELQKALKEKGHFHYHTATGYYGEITQEAVKALQKANGLPVTGQASLETLERLTAVSASSSSNQILREGTASQAVTDLQKQLKQAGYFKQEPSGYYGSVTTEAVKNFQRATQLKVDGVAGPKTMNALQNAMSLIVESDTSSKPADLKPTRAPVKQGVLRSGSKGQIVEQLQTRLQQLGYYTEKVTGQFGPKTKDAVRAFQEQNKLLTDGIVGAQTWGALNNTNVSPNIIKPPNQVIETPVSVTPTPVLDNSPLRLGSSGAEVSNLQSRLRSLGLFSQEPTGYYGTVTEQAVKAFQRKQGLTVDGVVGQQTLQRINEAATVLKPTTEEFNVMNLVADSSELLNIPYVWGGTTIDGFDCSGFIGYVFAKNGIQLPRTVASMWERGIEVTEPQIGDLVFYETYEPGPSHAGIYIGNRQFVHSGTSTGVTVANMNTSYWSQRYLGVKRLH